jgi:WD40 repeat protein
VSSYFVYVSKFWVVFLYVLKDIYTSLQSGRRGRPSFQVSGSGVRTCRFSPDGHLLVTAGDDEKAFVWSTSTMEQLLYVTELHKVTEQLGIATPLYKTWIFFTP